MTENGTIDPRYDVPGPDLSGQAFHLGDSYEEDLVEGDLARAQPFRYGPIQEPFNMRVLMVYPGAPEDPIHSVLTHQRCSEAQYQAISYTWGNPAKSHQIMCNGGVLSITENLHAFLIDMRKFGDSEGTSILWVDGICINQEDMAERESQVRMMTDIYRNSLNTIVWLGPCVQPSENAFELMEQLNLAYDLPDFQKLLQRDDLEIGDLDHSTLGHAHVPQQTWMDLEKLFSYPWYERIWVCQEVALSEDTVVMCGGHLRPWSFCVRAAYWMHKMHWKHSMGGADSHFDHILRIDSYRQIHAGEDGENQHRSTMLNLLNSTRGCKASEPLDKVFAILGLVIDIENIEKLVDYSMDPLQLYGKVTTMLLMMRRSLDVLHLADNDPDKRMDELVGIKNYRWPSWVPNFSRPYVGRQLVKEIGKECWAYCATGEKEMTLSLSEAARMSAPPTMHTNLRVTGLVVDRIKIVAEEMIDTGYQYGCGVKGWYETALLSEGSTFVSWKDVQNMRRDRVKSDGQAENTGAAGLHHQKQTLDPDMIQQIIRAADDLEAGKTEAGALDSTHPYPTGERAIDAFWRTLIGNKDGSDRTPDDSIGRSHFEPWLRAAIPGDFMTYMKESMRGDLHGPQPIAIFNEWVTRASTGSCLFRTDKGYFGTCSKYAKPGDLVCVLYGGQSPFVLRREGEEYLLISDCYTHGIMNGEALDLGLPEQIFELV